MEKLIFGWVSDQIQSNYAAWSNWKSTGNQSEADAFYEETSNIAQREGLTWFCYSIEE